MSSQVFITVIGVNLAKDWSLGHYALKTAIIKSACFAARMGRGGEDLLKW